MKPPRFRITEKTIPAIPPGRHRVEQGLYLCVSPDGRVRRFEHRYSRPNNLGPNNAGLGVWPEVCLDEARAQVLENRQLLRKGTDPVEHRRAQRKAQVTFKEVADRYINATPGSKRNSLNLLNKHCKALHNLPVSQVTKDHVRDALAPIMHTDKASRTLYLIKAVLEDSGYSLLYKLRNHVTHNNHPGLPYAELPAFMQQLRTMDCLEARALEFLILTVTPTKEVRLFNMKDVDMQNHIWSLVRYKTNQPHRIPLSSQAMDLMDHNWSHLTHNSLRRFLRRLHPTATVHGFRGTFRTWGLEKTDFDFNLLEMCLMHKVGNPVARAYLRGDALEKRREIMQAWADYCAS